MSIQSCPNVVDECLPCNDSPVLNLSAESGDTPTFLGFYFSPIDPGLGETFAALGCLGWFFSAISQADADAQAEAICTGVPVPPPPTPEPEPEPEPEPPPVESPWVIIGDPETYDDTNTSQFPFAVTTGTLCTIFADGFFCDGYYRDFLAYRLIGPYATDKQLTIRGTGVYTASHAVKTQFFVQVGISQDSPLVSGLGQCDDGWSYIKPIINEDVTLANNLVNAYGLGVNVAWDTDDLPDATTFLLPAGQSRYMWFAFSFVETAGGDPGCATPPPSPGSISGTIVLTVT